ncbi:MAG: 50S ribosomal protein L13 [Actinobacteria bacterium]|nr:50S ribosomal protein L13 [Cyanobacteriota bacterium]MCL5770826.1 50S ribosomal protein L13 [Actinomycetota bacterium]
MVTVGTKTYSAKEKDIEKKWYVIDASGKTLGRISTEIAKILRGKNKPIFTPHVDCGDYVIVINSSKLAVTGNKLEDKKYYRHSGYVGNMKITSLGKLMKKSPQYVLLKAVKGMLPHNILGRKLIKKLKIYPGPVHPHKAQKPEVLEV